MVKKIKDKATKVKDEIHVGIKNFVQFVEASSLLGVALYTGFKTFTEIKGQHLTVQDWDKYLFLFFALVVGIRAAIEYRKHFTGKE